MARQSSTIFIGPVTLSGAPTVDLHAATKAYVDATKQGLDLKDSVRVATTVNGALATAYANTSVVDGVTLATGDRILLKDQTAGAENGIYTVNATGAPTRSTDADSSSEVTAGMYAFVSEGTANADKGYVLTTNDPITLGTTALVFTQFSGAGQITAGAGLTKTGDTLDVIGTANRIVVAADTVDIGTDVVTLAGTQTLTNKTLTSPVVNTPTGIVKADVGLANVDNTSDATKQAAIRTQVRTQPLLGSDFLNTVSLTPFAALGIASGAGTTSTVTINHPGIYRARSSTTANSGVHIGTNTNMILLGGGEEFEAIFSLPLVAGSTVRIGFHDSASSADAVDGCYIEIPDTGVVTGKTSSNSVRSTTATTYTSVANTWYRLKIVLNADATSVTFTLFNEAGTSLWTDSLTTNIPIAAGRETGAAIVGTNSGTVAVDVYNIDYMSVYFGRTLVR